MRSFLIVLLSFSFSALFAQAGNPAAAGDATLRDQFDEMLEVSNRYQTFKVVKQTYLDAFITNVNDSIATFTNRIDELETTLADRDKRIEQQGSEIEERDASISQLSSQKDSISLLGLQLSKATYSLIMWGLVIGLLIALLISLAGTRVASAGNAELTRERDKLAAELDQSRKNRLTVEQELRRQLQDEINRRNA